MDRYLVSVNVLLDNEIEAPIVDFGVINDGEGLVATVASQQ